MKRAVVIILVAALLLAIACLVLRASHAREFQAKGRVRLERGPIELSQTNSYDPYFLQTHFEIISNLLSSPESLKELERRTELKSSEFRFLGVDPFRSTSLACLHFAGADSKGVERVASNACVMIERFYATNQSAVLVSYVDTVPVIPTPFWQRIIDELDYMIRR